MAGLDILEVVEALQRLYLREPDFYNSTLDVALELGRGMGTDRDRRRVGAALQQAEQLGFVLNIVPSGRDSAYRMPLWYPANWALLRKGK